MLVSFGRDRLIEHESIRAGFPVARPTRSLAPDAPQHALVHHIRQAFPDPLERLERDQRYVLLLL